MQSMESRTPTAARPTRQTAPLHPYLCVESANLEAHWPASPTPKNRQSSPNGEIATVVYHSRSHSFLSEDSTKSFQGLPATIYDALIAIPDAHKGQISSSAQTVTGSTPASVAPKTTPINKLLWTNTCWTPKSHLLLLLRWPAGSTNSARPFGHYLIPTQLAVAIAVEFLECSAGVGDLCGIEFTILISIQR